MTMSAKVDVDDTVRDMRNVGLNISKLMPKLIARLSQKGAAFMKPATPYRTGALRRGIHAAPTTNPNRIASVENYVFIANIRSRSPGYIEKTEDYIEKIIPIESDIVIKQALRNI